MKKISFLGPHGTFTEEALHGFINHVKEYKNISKVWSYQEPIELNMYSTIDSVLNSILVEDSDYAFVPIENSLGGSVLLTTEFLATHNNLEICAEVVLPIKHYLWVKNNHIKYHDIKRIYSHPQALLQCKEFFQNYNTPIKLIEMPSTANAAQYVSEEDDLSLAAVGSKVLGITYGLTRIGNSIEDSSNNQTRFIVVRKNWAHIDSMDYQSKTSIVFEVDGLRPGSLYESLAIFAHRKINLVRIESRPTKEHLGEYKFFFDLDSSNGSDNIKEALHELNALATTLEILGSYEVWKIK